MTEDEVDGAIKDVLDIAAENLEEPPLHTFSRLLAVETVEHLVTSTLTVYPSTSFRTIARQTFAEPEPLLIEAQRPPNLTSPEAPAITHTETETETLTATHTDTLTSSGLTSRVSVVTLIPPPSTTTHYFTLTAEPSTLLTARDNVVTISSVYTSYVNVPSTTTSYVEAPPITFSAYTTVTATLSGPTSTVTKTATIYDEHNTIYSASASSLPTPLHGADGDDPRPQMYTLPPSAASATHLPPNSLPLPSGYDFELSPAPGRDRGIVLKVKDPMGRSKKIRIDIKTSDRITSYVETATYISTITATSTVVQPTTVHSTQSFSPVTKTVTLIKTAGPPSSTRSDQNATLSRYKDKVHKYKNIIGRLDAQARKYSYENKRLWKILKERTLKNVK